jgi:hypothetical protein
MIMRLPAAAGRATMSPAAAGARGLRRSRP